MGIQGLWTYLNKHKYDVVFKDADDLTVFAGQTWVIDTAIYMYKFGLGKSVPPIDDFLDQARELMAINITPIYLFDGKRHDVKQFEHARRREHAAVQAQHIDQRKTLLTELEAVSEVATADDVTTLVLAHGSADVRKVWESTLSVSMDGSVGAIEVSTDMPKLLTYMKDRQEKDQSVSMRIPDFFYSELMQIFERENIKFYIATGDAEQLGAKLCRDGLAAMLVTDDGDALAFGAPYLFRNLFRPGMTGNQVVALSAVLQALNLTHPQFVDMCIMCGCDYTASRGLPNFGPKRAMDVVRKYGSLDAFLESAEWKTKQVALGDKFNMADFQYTLARSIFLNDTDQIFYASKAIDESAGPIPGLKNAESTETTSVKTKLPELEPAAKKMFKNVE